MAAEGCLTLNVVLKAAGGTKLEQSKKNNRNQTINIGARLLNLKNNNHRTKCFTVGLVRLSTDSGKTEKKEDFYYFLFGYQIDCPIQGGRRQSNIRGAR